MSDAGGDVSVAPAAAPAAPVEPEVDIHAALKSALRSAHYADGLAKGIHEAAKALDRREAHFAVLAKNCGEPIYLKVVEALCIEHDIPLIKVADKKLLGEWCGLCKYDQEGKARKVVGCSCAVVHDFGTDEQAKAVLLQYFASKAK